MSFRIQGNSLASSLAFQLLSSYDLRYLLSLSLAYPLAPDVLKALLEALYRLYPYNSKRAYQNFYDTHPLPDAFPELEVWVDEMFAVVFGTEPLTFSTLPTAGEWGPIYWRFLFALAEQIPEDAWEEKFFSALLPYILPCPTCQAHVIQYLEEFPLTFPITGWLKGLDHSIKASLRVPPRAVEKQVLGETLADDPEKKPLEDLPAHTPTKQLPSLIRRASKLFSIGASIQLPKDYVPKAKKCCGPRPS